MTAALDEAGLRDIAYDEPGPSGRGLYLAMRPG
jgi:hypothetical protein